MTSPTSGDSELAILFFSRLTDAAGDDYKAMDAELERRVRDNPGFVAAKSFTAADGERLTIVWWRDEASLAAWRGDERHALAQRTGRERWYQEYRTEVTRILRRSAFSR